MKKVQFCQFNSSHATEELADKLRDEGLDIEVEACLGYCGQCAVGPIALVDDELVQADTAEELYEKIKREK